MHGRLTAAAIALCASCTLHAELGAQASARPAPSAATLVRVRAENDYFDFWIAPRHRPDDNYTQGARASVLVPAAPLWGGWLGGGRPTCRHAVEGAACLATELTLGQEIYTPTDDSPLPQFGERPYAGWLFASISARRIAATDQRAMTLTLGVTGPPSLAAAAQDWFHHLVPGFRTPLGWDHQIPTTLGVSVAYDWEHLALAAGSPGARAVELVPLVGASVGNVLTEARAGVRGRVGIGLESPWDTPLVPRHALALYLLGEARVECIARELFLDARTIGDARQVEREPVLPEYAIGAGVRWRDIALEYRAVTLGREYRTGPSHHVYGSIAVTVH